MVFNTSRSSVTAWNRRLLPSHPLAFSLGGEVTGDRDVKKDQHVMNVEKKETY